MFIKFSCFRRYIIAHVFKNFKNICKKYSPNAHWIRLVRALFGFLFAYANVIDFENPIDIRLKIVVWKFQPAHWTEVSRYFENDNINQAQIQKFFPREVQP